MTTPTLEHRVAKTILQQPIGELTIDGTTYEIPAPTTATLIAVSGLISQLPALNINQPDEELTAEVLERAKDCVPLGQIAATLILGAKRIKEHKKQHRRWWHFLKKQQPLDFDRLAERILDNCTAKQLRDLIFNILEEAGLADFFVLTTSLHTKNILRRTEVERTTVPGQ